MRKKIIFIVTVVACLSVNASAQVYKWTGPDGRQHFGDRPPADASTDQVRIRSFTEQAEVVDNTAAKADSVVMLSAAWCGVCTRARKYMTEKGIAFTEYDVEKSDTGRSEYQRLKGRGVPIILVGTQRMNGFSVARLEQLLKPAGR